MKPKSIGIIGGAGPRAGAALLERVIQLAGKLYGCYRDTDFPAVYLISYPFSEMLTKEMDVQLLKKELKCCLNQLRSSGAAVLAIACNTLHAFLEEEDQTDLVHLPRAIVDFIPKNECPTVLCTSTSVKFGLHKKYFPCDYPDPSTQLAIDWIIDRVLQGEDDVRIVQDLLSVMDGLSANTIILGCTELSLLTKRLSLLKKIIIDPLDIVANELIKISFKGEK